MKAKVLLAAAGSGKTRHIVLEALAQNTGRILLTTYTQANELEIRRKFIELNKCIPANVTVLPWFSFLLKHGVRPFQPVLAEGRINGLLLVNSPSESGIKYIWKGKAIQYSESEDFERHYFTKSSRKIFSDKLSKFVCKCNAKSSGAVLDRLIRVFPTIFVDEVQDLAGYDLEILECLFKSGAKLLLVGDPRQATYSTNTTAKKKQFRKSEIVSFFVGQSKHVSIDDTSLNINYRCTKSICDLSNKLFPDHSQASSGNNEIVEHLGLFFVRSVDAETYLQRFRPIQLRDSSRTPINTLFRVMNFGESKGLSFDRTLIYPTKPMLEWLFDNTKELATTSRSKFYVALTRARYSVGIIYDFKSTDKVHGITNFVIGKTTGA
jgi:DNA helicase-2/ATP-dependent DNA helicase PcrA